MRFENSMTFVRSLKGAPASILWAFFFTRQTMTALELQQWTGYAGDNITVAIRLLVDLGWLSARSSRGPWCLVDGRQLPLMADSDLIGVREVASSSSRVKDEVPTIEPEEQEEDHDSDFFGVVAALDAAGIREPKRSQLARLKHVTVELINAHVEKCKAEGLAIGTAIHRIQYNWACEVRPRIKTDSKDDALRDKLAKLRARARRDEG